MTTDAIANAERQRTRIILSSLIFVALLGTIMRYKIGFALPFFHQKYLQEAHSHFAFAGWLTQVLMFLMVRILRRDISDLDAKPYTFLLRANLLTAYGMLLAFLFQGYGTLSIVFATASILVFFLFAWRAWRDIRRLPAGHPVAAWWLASLVLGILSTAGTFVLTRMLLLHAFDQHLYLGSIYFYLHFQYNGWFFFATMGLLADITAPAFPRPQIRRRIFLLFVVASLPAYFLSTLWANLPVWLYGLVILAAIAQVLAVSWLVRQLWQARRVWFANLPLAVRLLFLISGMALAIKLGLQLGSTLPEISKLAFGFRHIVIAYLHLVLLLILTVFLLGYLRREALLPDTPLANTGLGLFVAGAIFNELVLTLQGVASFTYTVIPGANVLLLGAAAIMLAGAAGLVAGFRRSS